MEFTFQGPWSAAGALELVPLPEHGSDDLTTATFIFLIGILYQLANNTLT